MGFAQNGAMLLVSAALAGVGVGSVQPNGLVLAMRRCPDDRPVSYTHLIELVCPDVENVRSIEGGVPFVVQLDEVARAKQNAAAENEPDIHQQTRITRKEA